MSTQDHEADNYEELLPDRSHHRDVVWYAAGASAGGLVFGGLQLVWMMPSHIMAAMGAIGLFVTLLAIAMTDI